MRPKLWVTSDETAQMHAMEAVIAALLFFGALQVGINLLPDSQSTTALDTLSINGADALRTFYYLNLEDNSLNGTSLNGTNSTADTNSSLVYYISHHRISNITDYLNLTLDSSISYSLSYWTQPDGNTTILYEMIQTVDESVTSHFCFFHQGILYDVRLVLWKEPRGVME